LNKENIEKIKPNVCLIKDCNRLIHKKSKYCIFHASAEEKTEKEFEKALKEYIQEIKEEDKDYNFRDFIFIGYIEFNNNVFKNTSFWGSIFQGDVDFLAATFIVETIFFGATFKGNVRFIGTTFQGYADFREATFKGDAKFHVATFQGDAFFSEATFKGVAKFYGATFEGTAYFSEAIFKGDADFRKVKFKLLNDFMGAIFEGNTDFYNAIFSLGNKLKLIVKGSGFISFEHTFLENVFLELYLDEGVLIDFTDVLLRNTKIIREQINNHILQEERKDFEQAKEVYLLLKNNFHSIGRYEDESWAFKKEKDMERKSYCHFRTFHKWLWSCFLNGIFGYGERPVRVIMSAILIILGFTFLFMISGISDTSIGGFTSKNFLDCIYFSVITFTTLGYGDFRPLEGCGRVFAGTEAFIGALIMALFVYTFARRTGGK
jgi:uncharacterized protein YjbI with pentapeptide repeats